MILSRFAAAALLATSIVASASEAPLLPVTDYQLPNGLKVIFHRDTSDPVVAVALTAHVGSARETPGRTGFAHMFEHLFFLDSENLGPGGLDRLSARVGGSGANGNTNTDATVYAQEVPKDALEKMIWAEADKLGWFINTVTDPVLAKEKQVVKNEKRQSYDNRPYGFTKPIIFENMFPADHPYSWSTIGSMADLDAATLDDVKAFYKRWYTPENTTLTIAGDFDPARARAWIDRYFGELKGSGKRPAPAVPRPAKLTGIKRLVHEDRFAKRPELTLAFPGAPEGDPDYVALELLLNMLTAGRDAPLTKRLVEDEKLTDEVVGAHYELELAGIGVLQVRAFDGVELGRVATALQNGLADFEARGVDPAALTRARLAREKNLYAGLENVDSKAQAIARGEAVTGRTDAINIYAERLRAVTPADISRVYAKYLKNKPYLAISMVPRGQAQLALIESTPAKVIEEAVVQNAEAPIDPRAETARYTPTPSKIDRKVEPPFGGTPSIAAPPIWTSKLANGLPLSGIAASELPLARFELTFDGGRLFDDPAKPGVTNLLSRMLTRGTARLSPTQFDNALKDLGADLSVRVADERLVLTGSTLARNLAPTLALVEELLVTPRWDPAELALAKSATIGEIQANRAEPDEIAARIADYVSFPGSVLAANPLGTEASVAALTMADLQAFHTRNLSPGTARFRIVGPATAPQVATALAGLAARWTTPAPEIPATPAPAASTGPELWFYDIPDAKQSFVIITGAGPTCAAADYYPATATNFLLGGGGFASRLTQQLREGKGYTYGVRSRFDCGRAKGRWLLESPVRSNVTLEAVQLAQTITSDYGKTFTAADLALTRDSLARARARAFETTAAKLRILADIGDYGRAPDFIASDAQSLAALTIAQVEALAAQYLNPARLRTIIVGDSKTQAARLEALGVGKPKLIDAKLLEASTSSEVANRK